MSEHPHYLRCAYRPPRTRAMDGSCVCADESALLPSLKDTVLHNNSLKDTVLINETRPSNFPLHRSFQFFFRGLSSLGTYSARGGTIIFFPRAPLSNETKISTRTLLSSPGSSMGKWEICAIRKFLSHTIKKINNGNSDVCFLVQCSLPTVCD